MAKDQKVQTKTGNYLETLKKIKRRVKDLNNKFDSGYKAHYVDLVDYLMPRNGLFLKNDTESVSDRGKKKGEKSFNNKAMLARRVLASAMMAGLTSHARPWLKLVIPSTEALPKSVEVWLELVSARLLQIFADSNFYSVMQGMYDELGVVGTSAMLIEEDFESVVRFRHLTVGEYRLAASASNRIDTLVIPRVNMTVENIVDEYGLENVRVETANAYKAGRLDDVRQVTVYIAPNPDYGNPKSRLSNSKYVMIEWEKAMAENQFLKITGFRERPFAVARWQVIGTDVYGSDCPGMMALPDVKQLQTMEKKKLKALDKHVDPPLQAPTTLQSEGVVAVAGGVNYIDAIQGAPAVKPAYEVKPDLQAMVVANGEVENRIDVSFFVDVFLSFMEATKRMTATEVREWSAEKLLMLGPVTELVESETLDPIVERTYALADRFGLIPPPPPELTPGAALKIDYIGMLSQAQKLSGSAAIERFIQFALILAEASPGSWDKVDSDVLIDEIADVSGVSKRFMRDDKEVKALLDAREQQMQQMQQMEMLQKGADAAQKIANTEQQSEQ